MGYNCVDCEWREKVSAFSLFVLLWFRRDWLRFVLLSHHYARLSLRRLGNNKTRWLCCAHCKNKERWLSIKLEVTSLLFLDSTSNTLFVIALALLVIPAGFEPTTHSLEGCCSIQLSYGTIDIARLTVAKCSAKVIKNWQFTIHSPKILFLCAYNVLFSGLKSTHLTLDLVIFEEFRILATTLQTFFVTLVVNL